MKQNGSAPSSQSQQSCPDCGFQREPGPGDYCEVCGYNFKTGAHGEIPMPPASTPAPAATPAPAPAPAPAPVAVASAPPPEAPAPAPTPAPEPTPEPEPPPSTKLLGWEIAITIDPSLKVEGSPEPPADFESIVAALRSGSNLIGRSSPRRGIEPEVALDHDDAVSHRHALLEVHADGSLTLRDIGSSNGTSVNGKEIKQLVDVTLNDGDQVTLGHWTRLLVKAVR
ncbi:MAG TPA: FHA domain-containing protein [Bryobacteraceae bacterium]|jgi:hypothetical protein